MVTCPTCDSEYSKLGNHFQWNPDHRPELSDRQQGIIDYLILRGANVRWNGPLPRLEVFDTSKQRLAAISDALGWVAHDVRPHAANLYSFTTVSHPSLDLGGPSDVGELRPFTARLLFVEAATFVGDIFGSLQIDLRGFDVGGEHLRQLLSKRGVATVEYDGKGYAKDTMTERYHYHSSVVVVPHYDALDLLEWSGLSVSDVAAPIGG